MKNDSELFLDGLRALQHTARTMDAQIGMILELAERPSSSVPESNECRHPMQFRRPASAMGHPNRFICQKCNKEVEE